MSSTTPIPSFLLAGFMKQASTANVEPNASRDSFDGDLIESVMDMMESTARPGHDKTGSCCHTCAAAVADVNAKVKKAKSHKTIEKKAAVAIQDYAAKAVATNVRGVTKRMSMTKNPVTASLPAIRPPRPTFKAPVLKAPTPKPVVKQVGA